MESLSEIRQRVTWGADRAGNIIDEAKAVVDHLTQVGEDLAEYIEDPPDPPPEEPGGEDPPVEPPAETPALIVHDDFESYAVDNPLNGSVRPPVPDGTGFRWTGQTNSTRVSDRHARTGTRGLLFDYPATALDQDSSREQRFQIAQSPAAAPSEIGMEWHVWVPETWKFRDPGIPRNNKFLALWGESYRAGNFTEPRFVLEWGWGWRSPDEADMWMGSSERGTAPGHSEPRRGGRQAMAVRGIAFDASMRGSWRRFRLHFKIATAGVIDLWRDDELIVRMPADWRTLPDNGPINYVRHGYLFGWSNAGFNEPTDFAIDNLSMWRGVPPWLGEMA